jgi:glutamate synthase domain-containing protein 1
MCGIVGLFLKTPALQPSLGGYFATMLDCLSSRGPDSAGFAIYGAEAPSGTVKLVAQHPEESYDWAQVAAGLARSTGSVPRLEVIATHARFTVAAEEKALRKWFWEYQPEITVMSVGRRMEIMKEVGAPAAVLARFRVAEMIGSHAIGHTRMATESAVSTAGSHPFSTGQDLCLVHNGSLSNHNHLRRELQRQGLVFQTENDSEVAAGYLSWRLREGASLEAALTSALDDLDGFYTFTVGTRDGFAVLRDPIACKPAVLAETDDYVAMGSEYRALTGLPGIEGARVWEPEPATVYTWSTAREAMPA